MENKYYQQELEALRDSASSFAAAYPAIAPQLGGQRPDPDVERILEGVAYLTGQIRSTLDEGFPEFAQGILNQIFPHYLRPIPSSTIIRFSPKNLLKSTITAEKGIYIDSKSIDGINCRFRTCFDVMVLPLYITKSTVEGLQGGRQILSLEFELQAMNLSEWKQDSIRLHIGGDYSGAADTYFILKMYIEKIEVCGIDSTSTHVFDSNSIKAVGFSTDESLLDYPSNSFPAYQLLQEYFLLKEKFLFIDISGLSKWTNRGTSKRFTVKFTIYGAPFALPKISDDRFILHATPAVNLFAMEAEPLLHDNRRNEQKIRPVRDNGGKTQVYSVDSVTGRAKGSTKQTEYLPLNKSFGSGIHAPVYQITYRSLQDGVAEPYMMISYPEEYTFSQQETLSIKLTCTNGAVASSLRPGDISTPTSTTSELLEFSNISSPTEYQMPPTDGTMLWKMLSHLSLNYLPVANVDNLRALLYLYVFSGGDKKAEIANKRRIAGIVDVNVKMADRLVKGVLMRGQEVGVTVDKDHFSSLGDLYVFGTVLDSLFASFSSMNVYTVLTIKDVNSREHLEWPARLGNKPLI